MDFAQKQYLFLYALIVTSLAASFFFIRRSPAQPVKLQMQDQKAQEPKRGLKQLAAGKTEPGQFDAGRESGRESGSEPDRATDREAHRKSDREFGRQPVAAQTALNVFFNWNGHSWDAYEVLALPAGSSRDAAKKAFEQIAANCDEESLLFFKAALDAILKSAVTRA